MLRIRLGLVDESTRCGQQVKAVVPDGDLFYFRLVTTGAFDVLVVLLAVAAAASTCLGPRGARILALATAAGLSFLALPVHGFTFPATCLMDLARWPYLVAAACVLVAGLGTPVRRLRPWPRRRI
ncbi:hypothetical protein [Nonomuraea sp. NPDC050691]|uniref:hypothetical protein n=1 Tax=Nonomuraea sp. NPDC050691 TaxID=3155661 RepID=UPI0033C176C2